jgi:hypothetical protein
LSETPAEILAAQEELARIAPSLAAFHSIAVSADIYDDELQALAMDVAQSALRLGLQRAKQLTQQIEAAITGG